MDYDFLKSKPLNRRVASLVQRAAAEHPVVAYCEADERMALKESRENPEQVYFLVSSGHKNKESDFMGLTTISAFGDIACEMEECAESLVSRIAQSEAELPEPLSTFSVRDVVEVNIYPDAETGGVFVRLEGDEILTNARTLLDAKARVEKVMAARGLHGINEDKSWVVLGDLKIPYHVDVPSSDMLMGMLADSIELNTFDAYAKLGLCHLYKDGACIARVNFTGPQFIAQNVELTHPHDDTLKFNDVSHAVSYSFGISEKISRKEAVLYGIGSSGTTASEEINLALDNVNQLTQLLHHVAGRHELTFDQTKQAFWDLYSGAVYGNDLRQYPEMKALYHDIAQSTGEFIPAAKPVGSLILQRLQDFDVGISPMQRQAITKQAIQQQEPSPQAVKGTRPTVRV